MTLPDVLNGFFDTAQIQILMEGVTGQLEKERTKFTFGHGRASGDLVQINGISVVFLDIADTVKNKLFIRFKVIRKAPPFLFKVVSGKKRDQ